MKPPLPFVPGAEVSGRVIEVGSDVRAVKVGDLVRPYHSHRSVISLFYTCANYALVFARQTTTGEPNVSECTQVCAVTSGGAFAEEATINEAAILKLPAQADAVAAAGLPVAFGTAHLALRERARLRAGQTVLILGAAGGVGVAAVQVQSCTQMLGNPEEIPSDWCRFCTVSKHVRLHTKAQVPDNASRMQEVTCFKAMSHRRAVCISADC